MYRKPSGRLGFSFTRAIQNAVPSITTTQAPGEGDANLTTVQKDDLVRFQLSLPDPRLLVEESFYVVHVTGNDFPQLPAATSNTEIANNLQNRSTDRVTSTRSCSKCRYSLRTRPTPPFTHRASPRTSATSWR